MAGVSPYHPRLAVKLQVSDPALAGGHPDEPFHLPLQRGLDVLDPSLQFPCHI